ncbi:hypothetical protein D3C80_1505700 [compost metagenome]
MINPVSRTDLHRDVCDRDDGKISMPFVGVTVAWTWTHGLQERKRYIQIFLILGLDTRPALCCDRQRGAGDAFFDVTTDLHDQRNVDEPPVPQ